MDEPPRPLFPHMQTFDRCARLRLNLTHRRPLHSPQSPRQKPRRLSLLDIGAEAESSGTYEGRQLPRAGEMGGSAVWRRVLKAIKPVSRLTVGRKVCPPHRSETRRRRNRGPC